jgi:hypothetical protein
MTDEQLNHMVHAYSVLEKFILNNIKELSNFGKDCDCKSPDKFCKVDDNDIICYCLNCGGIILRDKDMEIKRDLELNIKLSKGFAVVRSDNTIELTDSEDLTIKDLEYILKEATQFVRYKKNGLRDYEK